VYDPVAERLRSETDAFNAIVRDPFETPAALAPWGSLPNPASESELSARIDQAISAVWPEFRSTVLEADLLRRRASYYEWRNERERNRVSYWQHRLDALPGENAAKAQEIASTQASLVEARRQEAVLTRLALARLNDYASEQRSIATLLAFSPNSGLSPANLTRGPAVTALPDRGLFLPPAAGFAAPFAADPSEPTTYAELTFVPPSADTPIPDKLQVMQRVARGLRDDGADLPRLRNQVSSQQADYTSWQSQAAALEAETGPLQNAANALQARLNDAASQLYVSQGNQANASQAIVTEIIRDMALDSASARLRAIVDEIAGSEGLSARLPANRAQAMLDFARRGGHVLLPIENHPAQWDAFVTVQEQTLDVLDRAEGFMTEAVHLAASGSPDATEALLERVFASVNWQTYDLARTAASGVLPQGEDSSLIEDVFDRYLGKIKERQTSPDS
jgi:hypothetical protein